MRQNGLKERRTAGLFAGTIALTSKVVGWFFQNTWRMYE
jgi:hypothetical protein